jgi:SOS-response transcriptional repressor LexA
MVDNRPSKKQRELLQFIDGFIKGYGYGPSYREIMRALGYKSVSTVAIHIDGLIARGYIRKKTRSARSLEIITTAMTKPDESGHKKWLKELMRAKIEAGINEADRTTVEKAIEILLDEPQAKRQS